MGRAVVMRDQRRHVAVPTHEGMKTLLLSHMRQHSAARQRRERDDRARHAPLATLAALRVSGGARASAVVCARRRACLPPHPCSPAFAELPKRDAQHLTHPVPAMCRGVGSPREAGEGEGHW